jgi:hypothetical protein
VKQIEVVTISQLSHEASEHLFHTQSISNGAGWSIYIDLWRHASIPLADWRADEGLPLEMQHGTDSNENSWF